METITEPRLIEQQQWTQCELPPHFNVPRNSIIDIGGSNLALNMREWLDEKTFRRKGYQMPKKDGSLQRLLPSPMFSDKVGLGLWAEITHMPKYYQSGDEIALLEQNCAAIASQIPDGAAIIDMGSGDFRKIKPLLNALETIQKHVRYFALDLSWDVLDAGLREMAPKYKYVHCYGLWGLFNEGLEWLPNIPSPRLICSLGGSLGNDWYKPAVAHIQRWVRAMGPEDRILLGMDSCKDRGVVWESYHDSDGTFERFIRNGMEHANNALGHKLFRPEDWDVVGIFHENPTMHQFAFIAKTDIECKEEPERGFKKGDQIDCYEAFKYEPEELFAQFNASGLDLLMMWQLPSNPMYHYLLAPSVAQATA